jgi:hypothetical protein
MKLLPIIKMSMFCTTKQLSYNQKKAGITHIQEAAIALKRMSNLILGHYSTRYENIDFLRRLIFPRLWLMMAKF